jgi:hypothetical protein
MPRQTSEKGFWGQSGKIFHTFIASYIRSFIFSYFHIFIFSQRIPPPPSISPPSPLYGGWGGGFGSGRRPAGQRPVAVDGLIHFLHFFTAAFWRGRLSRDILIGVALIADVTRLVGPGMSLFFTLVLAITATTTHGQSPFSYGLGEFSPLKHALRILSRVPSAGSAAYIFIDNAYFLVIIPLGAKARACPIFSRRGAAFWRRPASSEKWLRFGSASLRL